MKVFYEIVDFFVLDMCSTRGCWKLEKSLQTPKVVQKLPRTRERPNLAIMNCMFQSNGSKKKRIPELSFNQLMS